MRGLDGLDRAVGAAVVDENDLEGLMVDQGGLDFAGQRPDIVSLVTDWNDDGEFHERADYRPGEDMDVWPAKTNRLILTP